MLTAPITPSFSSLLTIADVTSDVYSDIIEFGKVIAGTNREKMLIMLFEEFPHGLRIFVADNTETIK